MHNWEKTILPLSFNNQMMHDVYTAMISEKSRMLAVNSGGGKVKTFSNQPLVHWVLSIVNTHTKQMEEPTYQQKLMFLQEVGEWKNVALEVMPPEDEVVDREKVYHLWEFEYPYSFIFNYQPILQPPEHFEKETSKAWYTVSRSGKVKYLYFKAKNGRELGWREKQNLKNHAIGIYRTAVEIILPEMAEKDYSVMICLPMDEYLDFGLT